MLVRLCITVTYKSVCKYMLWVFAVSSITWVQCYSSDWLWHSIKMLSMYGSSAHALRLVEDAWWRPGTFADWNLTNKGRSMTYILLCSSCSETRPAPHWSYVPQSQGMFVCIYVSEVCHQLLSIVFSFPRTRLVWSACVLNYTIAASKYMMTCLNSTHVTHVVFYMHPVRLEKLLAVVS